MRRERLAADLKPPIERLKTLIKDMERERGPLTGEEPEADEPWDVDRHDVFQARGGPEERRGAAATDFGARSLDIRQ